jgi:uncharacterized repeat protein (TIGR03803 family)
LIQDPAGNLYGTTHFGGATSTCNPPDGCGVVFRLSPAGTETILHSFTGGADGAAPVAGLIRDAAGNLYGTTALGGASGEGVVFKLSPSGTETVLHSFTGPDGAHPGASLLRDAAGNLYGTTSVGGAHGNGVVFKLSPSGTETVLYSFTGGANGAFPEAALVRDAAGNLYGTTLNGGGRSFVCDHDSCGVVFKVSPTGTETVLHSFTGSSDGGNPYAGLVQDAAGNLYGTAVVGGDHGYGVVFELIRSDSGYEFKVLHSFDGVLDGANPYAGLVRDAEGNLYGTDFVRGAFLRGVVFKLIRCDPEPSGYEFKVLHSFTGGADGAHPRAGLVQDAAGNLYGTTSYGGAVCAVNTIGCGVVFKLTP